MQRLQTLPSLKRLAFLSPRNQELVTGYLTLLTARQYAPKSIQVITGAIKSFCVLLPAARRRRITQDVAQTTPEDVDAWLHAAHGKALAPATIRNTLNSLRRFFDDLYEQGTIPHQPIRSRRHRVVVPPTLPRPMADADLRRFFQVIDALCDRTMFLLMLRCGLRVGEVSTLRWSAINLDQASIRIDQSKGLVDRVVYYSADVETALGQWRHWQQPVATYLFPSPYKPGRPLHVRTIQVRMAHYLREAQIPTAYSPHSLRHTFATTLLNAGASLEVVKELMGHRSIAMTLRYTQLYEATKRHQYDQAMAHVTKRQALDGR